MDTIEMTFLDKVYELPKDILTYIDYHRKFDELKQSLLLHMLKHHDNGNLNSDESQFEIVASQCASWLCEQGIYAFTKDDYLVDNEGLELYREALLQTQSNFLDIETDKTKELLSSIDDAKHAAARNITGMGFSIMSSSFIDLGVWAAMESSTVKKQAAEADHIYHMMVLNAISRENNKARQQKSALLSTYWLPNLKRSIDIYIAIVFDRFIKHVIECGKFDKAALDFLDIKRANMIVNNISVAADKKQLLHEAFSRCPFAPSIYKETILLGEFSTNEYFTAKTFGLLDDVASDNREVASRIAQVMDTPESCIVSQLSCHAVAASLIDNIPPEEAIEDFLSLRRQENIHKIEALQILDEKSSEFDQLMRDAIANEVPDMLKVVEMDHNLSPHLYRYINTFVLLNDDSSFYDAYKNQAVINLASKATAYITEAHRRQSKYESCKASYLRTQERVDKQIIDLNAELDTIGFFGVFRRAEIINEKLPALYREKEEAMLAMMQSQKYFEEMYANS